MQFLFLTKAEEGNLISKLKYSLKNETQITGSKVRFHTKIYNLNPKFLNI
jgi:hypothetical protein